MKRNYEKSSLLIFIISMFIILEIIIVSIYFTNKYRTYMVIDTIVVTDNYVKTYIDSKTLLLLKSGSKFYIDDIIYKYKIIEIEEGVINKDNIKYHGVIIQTKFPSKYKDNDTVAVSIFDKKEKIYNFFKKCWESD